MRIHQLTAMTRLRLTFASLLCSCLSLACADDGGGSEAADGTESAGSDDSAALEGSCSIYSTDDAIADVFLGSGAVPGNTCELAIAACGGDVVGNWGLETSCGIDYPTPPNPWEGPCPGGNWEPTSAPYRVGSLAVEDDGTWSLSVSVVYDYDFSADISCVPGVWGCDAEAEAVLTEDGGTASCSGQATACSCTVTGVPISTTQLSGELGPGGMNLEPDNGVAPLPYCVEDGVLRLWSLSGSPSSSNDPCTSDADCSSDDQTHGVCKPD